MSAKYIPLRAKLKGVGRPFLEGQSIDLSSKLSLRYGGNVNHYKIVCYLLSTLPLGIGNTLAAFKTDKESLLSNVCPGIFSS